MKFTGQVRVPEVDHPGVPATFLVEDGQAEVFLDGESLGRWSLYDVHASRLVSNAFSLSLEGEEITFIADEPVDFAYKGVDHMAEVWARYKSMTFPRRLVAVGRSRRGTIPSRIEELREAMLQNLEAAGRGTPRLTPMVDPGQTPLQPVTTSLPVEEESERHEESIDRHRAGDERVFRPAPRSVASSDIEETQIEPIPRAPLRPGAGLFARRVSEPESHHPEPPTAESPWDEPLEAGLGPEITEPVGADGPEVPPVGPESIFAEEPQVPPEPSPHVPEPVSEETKDVAPAPSSQVPELVKELLGTSADESEGEGPRDLLVDLGRYEDRQRGSDGPPPRPDGPADREPVPAGAPVPSSERSGLLGAVRSAFVRNRAPHEHVFMEAPGGIGIVRQICGECGYISIGVSD